MTTCPYTPTKARFRDEIAAKLALSKIQRKDDSDRSKIPQRAYRCPGCHGWHLTAKPVDTKPRGQGSASHSSDTRDTTPRSSS